MVETVSEGTSGAARSRSWFPTEARSRAWLSTLFSAIALGFSGISFYMSALQGAELDIYIPPTIHYGRDGGGDSELFAIPITIANNGARSGTVLSIELEVERLRDQQTKRYYSAFLGEHPRDPATPNRQYAPLSIPGRAVFTETIRFYAAGSPAPKLVDEKGEYRFRLKLNTASRPDPGLLDRLAGRVDPKPVAFEMTLPWINDPHLGFRRATIAMHAKDWRPIHVAAPAAPAADK
jgi:hypothetical protein